MRRQKNYYKNFAKALVRTSLNEQGTIDGQRVSHLLKTLQKNPPYQFKRILKTYSAFLSAAMRRTTLRIECAGWMNEAFIHTIQTKFEASAGHALNSVQVINPDLIAGIRLTLGDTVWESSIKSRLEQIKLS